MQQKQYLCTWQGHRMLWQHSSCWQQHDRRLRWFCLSWLGCLSNMLWLWNPFRCEMTCLFLEKSYQKTGLLTSEGMPQPEHVEQTNQDRQCHLCLFLRGTTVSASCIPGMQTYCAMPCTDQTPVNVAAAAAASAAGRFMSTSASHIKSQSAAVCNEVAVV